MSDHPDLAELERLLAEATPGPWQADEATQTGQRATVAFPVVLSESTGEILLEGDFGGDTDAALIVAAVNALPFLLAEVRKANAMREALRYLAEWDETKATVLGSPDFRLIARAALEGASDA